MGHPHHPPTRVPGSATTSNHSPEVAKSHTISSSSRPAPHAPAASPPLSRAAQLGAGVSLLLAGLLNGGSQYLTHLLTGDHGDFSDQIRWGAEHPGPHQAEQAALVASMFFLPLGLLGLAHLARWGAPRLTAVALALVLWGMWGFHNVVALGYGAGSVAPGAIGVDAAVDLNESYLDHLGVTLTALVPHLLGSFLGLLLLTLACWRSGRLPRVPLALLAAFLVWDFLLAPVGPLEPHLLLAVALGWLGVHVLRMPVGTWSGNPSADRRATAY